MTLVVPDERLALRARAGDELAMRALLTRHHVMLLSIARGLYAPGLDYDDFDQEAAVGLYKAVRDWRPDSGTPFVAFAHLCVTRHLYTVVKTATRLKHDVLSWADRTVANDEGDTIDVIDLVAAHGTDPAEILEQRAQLSLLFAAIDDLTRLERDALIAFVFLDQSYTEIEAGFQQTDEAARQLRAQATPVKVVDNALTRARRKLRRVLADAENGLAA